MLRLAAGGSVRAALEERLDPAARNRLDARVEAGVPLLVVRLPEPFRAAFTTRWDTDDVGSAGALDLSLAPPRDGGAGEAHFARKAVGPGRERLRACLTDAARDEGLVLVSPLQVHGVRVVGAAEYARGSQLQPCDGLTFQPPLDGGLAPLLLFADCVPVLLVGEVDAALVHGGRRGLLGGIVQQGGAAMTAPPGLAVIGPSIGPCCYTVGDPVARDFEARYGGGVVLPGPKLDLWEVAALAAAEVGVPRARVVNPRLCTACNNDLFFSYRADGPSTGRHGAAVWSAA
ncbi:MAG: polyphenol oxidase family protein [Thermoleophilia bacterium]